MFLFKTENIFVRKIIKSSSWSAYYSKQNARPSLREPLMLCPIRFTDIHSLKIVTAPALLSLLLAFLNNSTLQMNNSPLSGLMGSNFYHVSIFLFWLNLILVYLFYL